MGHQRVEQAELQVGQSSRALAPNFHDTVDSVQRQTCLAQGRQTEERHRACPPHQGLYLDDEQPGAEWSRDHQIRSSLEESVVDVFLHRIDDQDDGHRGLGAQTADVCQGIAAECQRDQVGRSIQPGLHGPLQVVRRGHRQTGALEHQRKHCSLIRILSKQHGIHGRMHPPQTGLCRRLQV